MSETSGDRRRTKVRFNVSGQRFETWLQTLEKYADTLLGSAEREFFFDEDSHEYVLDRDPQLFRHILGYYQTGVIHVPRSGCLTDLDEELIFFRLTESVICDDCFDEYNQHDRRQHDEEQLKRDQEQEELLLHSIKRPTSGVDTGPGQEDDDPAPASPTLRQAMWLAFRFPHSSVPAIAFHYVSGFFTASSVVTNIAETVLVVPGCGDGRSRPPEIAGAGLGEGTIDAAYAGGVYPSDNACEGDVFSIGLTYLDNALILLFTVEYLLRLYAAPARFRHVRSAMSIVDLVAILPHYISLCISPDNISSSNFGSAFVVLRIFRVFRVFRLSRHADGLRVLGLTMRCCLSELGFLLLSLTAAILLFGTVIYYVERNVPDTDFTSIPHTFWYTIVTMTTLGYGDMVPKTAFGKVLGGVCSLTGVLVIALPVPVIVTNFNRIYKQAQRNRRFKRSIRNNATNHRPSKRGR